MLLLQRPQIAKNHFTSHRVCEGIQVSILSSLWSSVALEWFNKTKNLRTYTHNGRFQLFSCRMISNDNDALRGVLILMCLCMKMAVVVGVQCALFIELCCCGGLWEDERRMAIYAICQLLSSTKCGSYFYLYYFLRANYEHYYMLLTHTQYNYYLLSK